MGYPIAAQSPKIELSATFIVQTLTKEVVSSMGSATRLGICSWEALGIYISMISPYVPYSQFIWAPIFLSPISNPGQLVHPVEWLGNYLRLHPDWPVWPRQSRHNFGLVQEGSLGKASCAFFGPRFCGSWGSYPLVNVYIADYGK